MRRLLTLLVLLTACGLNARAQPLTLNLSLAPPYSPYFSDYLSIGNKALLTITNTGPAVDVFFRGSITGDNGVSGMTDANFRPGVPNTIAAGPAPVILRGPDFSAYFNFGNFNLTGITARELVTGAGLPEGNYTVCIQAFDYSTGAPVSNNACFIITIVYPEPPVPMTPVCESTVMPNRAQQITFTWAPSPGAPPRTRYVMKMVEMLNPAQNPYDALNTLTTPPFFETETSIPTYTYRLSDPVLTVGRRYAWGITAFDPTRATLFRNNGISPACVFTYGIADTLRVLQPIRPIGTPLVLVAPECKKTGGMLGGASLTGASNVTVDSKTPLNVTWTWPGEKMDTSGGKIGAPKTALGKTIHHYTVLFTPAQQTGDKKTPVPGSTDKPFTTTVAQSQLYFNLPLQNLYGAGLQFDHWYTVTVSARTAADSMIATTAGCAFQLKKGAETTPGVLFKGVVAYRLEDGGLLYPANKALFSINLNSSNYALSIKKGSMPAGATRVDVQTDDSGRFSVMLPVPPAMQNMKFVDLHMVTPYYAPIAMSPQVDMWTRDDSLKETPNPDFPSIQEYKRIALKPEVNLGQIAVDAYSYTLKVKVGKGFPDYFYSAVKSEYTSEPIAVDSLSINPKAKLKPGIEVALYRYSKDEGVPFQEGDNRVLAAPKSGTKRYEVARGKTVAAKDPQTGADITTVVFPRLLCNRLPGDRYYMQADLPKTALADLPGGAGGGFGSFGAGGVLTTNVLALDADDDLKHLEAPEVEVDFPDAMYKPEQKRYDWTMDYKLISTIPPISQVSGKLMYNWPSKPGVQRPLGKAKFTVHTAYLYNGSLVFPDLSECQVVSKTLFLNGIPPKPGEASNPLNEVHDGSGGLEVGHGMTSADGSFTVRFVNYDQKGRIADSATAMLAVAKCPPSNGGPKAEKAFEKPLDKYGWAVNPDPTKQSWQQKMESILFNDPGMKETGAIAIDDHGLSTNAAGAFTNTHYNVNQNPATVNVAGSGGGLYTSQTAQSGTAAAAAGKGVKGKGAKGGPHDEDEDWAPDDEVVTAKSKFQVSRILVIRLQGPHAAHYGDPVFIVPYNDGKDSYKDGFAVQAFETKNIGTLVSPVREWQGPAAVLKSKKSGEDNKAATADLLTNAKVVVYRKPGAKPDALPDAEGTSKHPSKPLIESSMMGSSSAPVMEWIADTGFNVAEGNQIRLGDQSLLAGSGDYYVQIASNPNGNGMVFKPKTLSFAAYMDSVEQNRPIIVELDKGKITGRVTDEGSKLPVPNPRISLFKYGTSESITIVGDDQGYWEYINGKPIPDDVEGWTYLPWKEAGDKLLINVCAQAAGYPTCKAMLPANAVIAPKTGLQTYVPIELTPPLTVKMKLVDAEDKKTMVAAYVQRIVDTSVKPFLDGNVSITSALFDTVKLRIIPEDLKYFDTTIVLVKPKGPLKDLGTVFIPQRLHRIFLDIVRQDVDGKTIAAMPQEANLFRATINNDTTLAKTTEAFGTTIAFKPFANVSVNNYSIVVTSKPGAGYIPQVVNVTNKESRGYTTYKVVMRQGIGVYGTVKLDGTPVKGARVYIEHSSQSGIVTPGQFEAWRALDAVTGEDGKYILNGIPNSLYKKGVNIHATIDTSAFTVDGVDTTLYLVAPVNQANFSLKKLGDFSVNKVWGYAFTPEKVKPYGPAKDNKYAISGLLNPYASSNNRFSSLAAGDHLRMEGVIFKKETVTQGGKTTEHLVPAGEEIVFDQTALKMRFRAASALPVSNGYNVELRAGAKVTDNLRIKAKTVGSGTVSGFIDGKLRIVDNSYNYPSSYLSFTETGDFYLARPADVSKNPEVTYTVLRGAGSTEVFEPLLTDSKGDSLRFRFMGFKAAAAPKTSKLTSSGKMNLDITFHGEVPNSGDDLLKIHLPKLVLDGAKIEATSGSAPLVMKLQDWTLRVKDWVADPVRGGIYSGNAVIETGVTNLQMRTFNLRSDLFVLDSFNPADIKLGAITLQAVAPGAVLVFDQKVGSDKGKHWRFNLSPKSDGGPAATIQLAPGNNAADKLDIDYMQLISYNNENIVTLRKKVQPMHPGGNARIDFFPSTLSSAGNAFVLNGETIFKAPNMPALQLGIAYTPTGTPNKYDQAFQSFDFEFDGAGYTRFTSSDNKKNLVVADPLVLKGTVVEKGKFNPIACSFTIGSNNPGTVEFTKSQTMTLVGETKLKLDDAMYRGSGGDKKLINGMSADAKSWSTLRFSGILQQPGQVMADTTVDFEVLGAITADAKGIRAKDIETPFGKLAMEYDLPAGELRGTMRMDNVKFGEYQFTGDVETRVGTKGFFTLCAGQLNTGTLFAEGFGTFSAGFVLGKYMLDDGHIKKVTQFTKDRKAACWLTSANSGDGFRGFYFTGGYDIINTQKGFDIGIAAMYFNAVLGVEGSLGLNLKQQKQIMLGLGAHGKVEAGMSAITGTSVKGSLEGHLTADAFVNLGDSNYGINGAANLGLGFRVKQELLVKTLTWDLTQAAGVTFTYSKAGGSSFDYFLDDTTDKLSQCEKPDLAKDNGQ